MLCGILGVTPEGRMFEGLNLLGHAGWREEYKGPLVSHSSK